MRHKTAYQSLADQTKLFTQSWQPDCNPSAIIVLVHGIGEHSSRYYSWAEKFVAKNIAVFSFDQRGHGLSDGKRGVISSYKSLMDDIDLVLFEASQQFPELPCFLYGHSMGGGEVLNHLLTNSANYIGVISTSPWIRTQTAPSNKLIPIIRFFDKIIPRFRIKTVFNSNKLSHNKDVVKMYKEDHLVHNFVSFRLFIEAYDAGYSIIANSKKLYKPLLLLHGSDDEITDPTASREFSKGVPKLCTYKEYPKAYHELHNDFCKEQVFADIVEWIKLNLKVTI